MISGKFFRNVHAQSRLEAFLLSAITSLLLVRLYLYLTGFPQLGGGGLHIAHMLWGGLLMLTALIMSVSFLGARVQRIVAVVGGAGFGVFIDELGKFITHDNDYFYRPAIAIIYAIFVAIYLGINFLGKQKTFTSREYQLNALSQLEEAILDDMDEDERRLVRELLDKADPDDPLTKAIRHMLSAAATSVKPRPSRLQVMTRQVKHFVNVGHYSQDTRLRILVAERVLFVACALAIFTANFVIGVALDHHGIVSTGLITSTLASLYFVVKGALLWKRSRLDAYEQFRRATLINLLLPQFFYFALIQFAALPGFLFSLLLLRFIAWQMHYEVHLKAKVAR